MELEELIRRLIETGKEGDFWDYKAQHHDKAGDLIKDIICLANATGCDGDRFLIFGVADDCSVPGLPPGSEKKQADIIDTLRNAGFASDNYPDVHLQDLVLEGKPVQVLIVKDRPKKPYYLHKKYDKQGVRLSAGTIYSRVRDTNTPSDSCASPADIERMWRQRFGLDQTPLQRMMSYLLDFDGWTETSENCWHYTNFPEFTVSPTDDEIWEVHGAENWVRAAINPRAFVRPMKLAYHQTILSTVTCIYYDEMRYMTPAPKAISDPVITDLCFYAIDAGTLDFRFLQFLKKSDKTGLLVGGLDGSRGAPLPVAIFESGDERLEFLETIKANPVVVKPEHQFRISAKDPNISDKDREIIAYSRAVLERLGDWRAGGGSGYKPSIKCDSAFCRSLRTLGEKIFGG